MLGSAEGVERLIAIASSPLVFTEPALEGVEGARLSELLEMLRARNGFYAFESALHVFPSAQHSSQQLTLEVWNSDTVWKDEFQGLADGVLCFAEDVFGVQFAIAGDEIVTFDPETGAKHGFAENLRQWAGLILDRYRSLTGFPLAHEWQLIHGQLDSGYRLLPKIPFVMGGEYLLENLYASEAVIGMRARGSIATQIRDLPDGTTVDFVVE